VVHGRDSLLREVQHYIQNVLKLGNPVILGDERSGRLRSSESSTARRRRPVRRRAHDHRTRRERLPGTPEDAGPRQGAAERHLRMGYWSGKLGRTSGRVLLLAKGGLECPPDLGGVIYIDVSNGVEAAGDRSGGAGADHRRAVQPAGRP